MAEYALVIGAVTIIGLFTGYQHIGNIIANTINTVAGLL